MNNQRFDQFTLLSETERIAKIGSWQWRVLEDEFNFSRQWQIIHGVPDAKLKMSDLMPIAHPDDLEEITQALDAVLNGEADRYDIEHRIIQQNTGKTVYVRAIGEVAERSASGEPMLLYGFAQDVTENAETKERLLRADEMVSSTGEMMADIDEHYIYRAANREYLKAFGLNESENIGKTVSEETFLVR